jgi:hypothetical protein
MELQDSISDALLSIAKGVENANKVMPRFRLARTKHESHGIMGENVEFDIQVVVTETGAQNAKGGISISVINLGGESPVKNP